MPSPTDPHGDTMVTRADLVRVLSAAASSTDLDDVAYAFDAAISAVLNHLATPEQIADDLADGVRRVEPLAVSPARGGAGGSAGGGGGRDILTAYGETGMAHEPVRHRVALGELVLVDGSWALLVEAVDPGPSTVTTEARPDLSELVDRTQAEIARQLAAQRDEARRGWAWEHANAHAPPLASRPTGGLLLDELREHASILFGEDEATRLFPDGWTP